MSFSDRKRKRTDDDTMDVVSAVADLRSSRSVPLASLDRDVSPPGSDSRSRSDKVDTESKAMARSAVHVKLRGNDAQSSPQIIPSPFKLTRIRDLPAEANTDTIGIQDILGNVMLKEIWLFDFLFDVDWVMQQLDPDTRHLVLVTLVHGSWRREDLNKIYIDEATKRYQNVRAVTAHMPEMYGCHHSKCMVLFRHDDLCQIVIHTANMIEQDWRNMTQGAWLSPLLTIKDTMTKSSAQDPSSLGTGTRFKYDLMAYLKYYGNRTKTLVSQLDQFDFTPIRAVLVAHVPAKFDGKNTDPKAQLWGWPALKRALGIIPQRDELHLARHERRTSQISCQVSSIASLSDKWIHETFFPALKTTPKSEIIPESPPNPHRTHLSDANPALSIIFPTPAEVRNSLDGYAAGASIHCKLQTASQRKQFDLMKPYLCHWASNPISSGPERVAKTSDSHPASNKSSSYYTATALRGPAAPHIKTFIRFGNPASETNMAATPMPTPNSEIDWALLTSANLSTQAWGTAMHAASGEVRISSYELGVLVWPDLFVDDYGYGRESATDLRQDRTTGGKGNRRPMAKMIPTFRSDVPISDPASLSASLSSETKLHENNIDKTDNDSDQENQKLEQMPTAATAPYTLIGLRMPYDLPLTRYGPCDEVWSSRSWYREADRFGRSWNVDT